MADDDGSSIDLEETRVHSMRPDPPAGSGRLYYPAPSPVPAVNGPHMWGRGRVVVHCFDFEQAKEIAAKVAEIVACDAEAIVGISHGDTNSLLSETVFRRDFYPVRINGEEARTVDEAPAEADNAEA